MADNNQSTERSQWPLVKFQFKVKIGTVEIQFSEVTGLSSETQVIEYRVGDSKVFSTTKMPGIQKFSNVVMKKGNFKDDRDLWNFYDKVKMNTADRQTVTISLLDENNEEVLVWELNNAFPVKMTVTDMKADANEAAVETIEFAHEGLSMTTPAAEA